jgi:hypothetical protein
LFYRPYNAIAFHSSFGGDGRHAWKCNAGLVVNMARDGDIYRQPVGAEHCAVVVDHGVLYLEKRKRSTI